MYLTEQEHAEELLRLISAELELEPEQEPEHESEQEPAPEGSE
ncbi:hypothetical protein ACFQ9X_21995 [Catenulispora yoronensis]